MCGSGINLEAYKVVDPTDVHQLQLELLFWGYFEKTTISEVEARVVYCSYYIWLISTIGARLTDGGGLNIL